MVSGNDEFIEEVQGWSPRPLTQQPDGPAPGVTTTNHHEMLHG